MQVGDSVTVGGLGSGAFGEANIPPSTQVLLQDSMLAYDVQLGCQRCSGRSQCCILLAALEITCHHAVLSMYN